MTKHQEYTDRLLKSFPATLHNDVLKVIDILPLDKNNVTLNDRNVYTLDNLIHESQYSVDLDNETLVIPYRLYFNEPDKEKERALTETQKAILNCIYLRHHDGFLRQRRLEQLVDTSYYWTIPFLIQLLGEYVFEILVILDKHINDKNIHLYQKFIKENPKHWRLTEKRVVSYWNEYYKRPKFPVLKDYVGQQIVSRLKKATA